MDDKERADLPCFLTLYGVHALVVTLSFTATIEYSLSPEGGLCEAVLEAEADWWTMMRIVEVMLS